SKDLWIVSDRADDDITLKSADFFEKNDIAISNLTTKRAENLFWLGRYLQRGIVSARMIRLNIKHKIGINRLENTDASKIAQDTFDKALTHLTMTYPGFLEKQSWSKEINSILKNSSKVGSLPFTFSMLSGVSMNIKNQLTSEATKIFGRLEREWQGYVSKKNVTLTEHIEMLDKYLIYTMAYKELLKESIFKEQGLVFYEIGSSIEVAMLLISKMRSMLVFRYEKGVLNEVLKFMMDSYEAYNVYKIYYKSNLDLEFVVDFLVFEKNYPKSLFSIISNLVSLVESLIDDKEIKKDFDGSMEYISKLEDNLNSTDAKKLLVYDEEMFMMNEFDKFLEDATSLLIEFSNEFTKNFFSHYYE
ncbi:MAG: alpha-E domain-containing protein, partial [Campylobacterales bacterium]|nr:alpha-E domain-containing protein [Campylobacterales bacterium]